MKADQRPNVCPVSHNVVEEKPRLGVDLRDDQRGRRGEGKASNKRLRSEKWGCKSSRRERLSAPPLFVNLKHDDPFVAGPLVSGAGKRNGQNAYGDGLD